MLKQNLMIGRNPEPKLVALLGHRRTQKQEEEHKEKEEKSAVAVDVISTKKSDTKLVLQIAELIGYSLLGVTGFSWLFWFNSPFFEFIEVPVIAGIILIATSILYDNKTKKNKIPVIKQATT
ncbi:MAG: hypothetical protein PXY39_04665 [archaeon]|nr:hypothetical protein [archaeon]